jgi:hypothetical protein
VSVPLAVADGVCSEDIGTGITDISLITGLLIGEIAVERVEPEVIAIVSL